MHDRPRKHPTMANGNQNDIVLRNKFGVMAARKARLSLWICGQCCAPAGLPWITMKPLSTAPASAHKLHRPQVFCMKDRPNDNYLEVTFFGEATGPDFLLDAVQPTPKSFGGGIWHGSQTGHRDLPRRVRHS